MQQRSPSALRMHATGPGENESTKMAQYFSMRPLNLTILPVCIRRDGVSLRAQKFEQLFENRANKSFSVIAAHNGSAIISAVDCVQTFGNSDGIGVRQWKQLQRAGKGINYDKHLDVPVYVLHWHFKDIDGDFTEGWLSNPATARCRRREGS